MNFSIGSMSPSLLIVALIASASLVVAGIRSMEFYGENGVPLSAWTDGTFAEKNGWPTKDELEDYQASQAQLTP